ncbi:hypothetical protein [Nonomuraea sp. B19D2]
MTTLSTPPVGDRIASHTHALVAALHPSVQHRFASASAAGA